MGATASNAPASDAPSDKLATVPGVEIFATGNFRGRNWTLPDLFEIARNFKRLGPEGKNLLRPPAVLGHEETQEYLEKTNLPAAAWPDKVWVEPYRDKDTGKIEGILKANFAEVPQAVAKLINDRAYRKVSAEIYDDFEDDHGKGHGKALRRVALLGGEIPQVKRLADIPLARFTEGATGATGAVKRWRAKLKPDRIVARTAGTDGVGTGKRGVVFVFSDVERVDMDRDALVKQLKAAFPSLDDAVIKTMTDEQVKAMIAAAPKAPPDALPVTQNADGGMGGGMDDQNTPEAYVEKMVAKYADDPNSAESKKWCAIQKNMTESFAGADDLNRQDTDPNLRPQSVPNGVGADDVPQTRESLIAELVGLGQDPAVLASMSDDDLINLYAQVAGNGTTNNADGDPVNPSNPYPASKSTPPDGKPNPTPTVPKMGDVPPKKVTMHFADKVRNAVATVVADKSVKDVVAKATKFNEELDRERAKLAEQRKVAKRQDAETFCEKLVTAGQIRPVDKDTYVDALVAKDDTNAVVKFSEGKGKPVETLTAFEVRKRELAKLPVVVHFGEKLKNGDGSDVTPGSDSDPEVAKVKEFAATLDESALSIMGQTRQKIVHAFTERRKRDPKATAELVIGPQPR